MVIGYLGETGRAGEVEEVTLHVTEVWNVQRLQLANGMVKRFWLRIKEQTNTENDTVGVH